MRFLPLFFLKLLGLVAVTAPLAGYANSGNSISVDAKSNSLVVVTGSYAIRLEPWSAGTLRVEVAPGATLPRKQSLAVISAPSGADWRISQNPGQVILQSPRLRAILDTQTGAISVSDGSCAPLFEVNQWSFAPASDPVRDGLQPSAAFSRKPGEHFYGGGVIGRELRQSSASIDFSNSNTRIRVPVIYSSRGYGLLWDNAGRSTLKLAPEALIWNSASGDLADFYVMAGPAADQVVAEYRALTGAAPLFPKWAYGFWFSKNKFSSQREILDAAQEFRSRQFPVDLLIQDYYFWKPGPGGVSWGSHEFDSVRYPDPKGMIEQLHQEDHLHFMAVIWAKFHAETEHYKELSAANCLFPAHGDWAGPTLAYYNPFTSKGRELYGKQVMDSLLSLGQDGFWMDGAEPEIDLRKFAAFDTGTTAVSRVMSAFPLMHTQAVYEAQRSRTSDKRVVLLPRSAWAGFQRNSACNWTGDISQNWQTLAWQIEGLQNFSITGVPYITTDVGGYEPDKISESDRELFVRWFQWGTFCPIYRVHGIARPFPWQYGAECEAILKKFDHLRYRLLPYIYTQASRITRQNGTLMRPLVMDFQDDAKALETWDEFMFGSSVLVCPVYHSSRQRVPVTLGQWADRDGKPEGITATYLTQGDEPGQRAELKQENPRGPALNPGQFEGSGFWASVVSPEQAKAKSVRIETSFTPQEDGKLELEFASDGYPENLTLDGKPVAPDIPRERTQFPDFPFNCKAGVPIRIAFESADKHPAFRIVRLPSAVQTKEVYLPGKGEWYDFWTGKRLAGGQSLKVETPLNMIPLFVRAGAIIPMGPELQYANEKPSDPIELRVYPGADGQFTLYEDEGDNYHYEKGAFSQIPIIWNDSKRALSIGARQGEFPGMLKSRRFNVILVKPHQGVGEEIAAKTKAVQYDGHPVSLNF